MKKINLSKMKSNTTRKTTRKTRRKTCKGSGLLNKLIDWLPIELHVPGTNFTGPGTKLKERLARGDKPVPPP